MINDNNTKGQQADTAVLFLADFIAALFAIQKNYSKVKILWSRLILKT